MQVMKKMFAKMKSAVEKSAAGNPLKKRKIKGKPVPKKTLLESKKVY